LRRARAVRRISCASWERRSPRCRSAGAAIARSFPPPDQPCPGLEVRCERTTQDRQLRFEPAPRQGRGDGLVKRTRALMPGSFEFRRLPPFAEASLVRYHPQPPPRHTSDKTSWPNPNGLACSPPRTSAA
jgi:hypothetical protein